MKTTPKDFFLWVGAMIALYFSVGSFVRLVFAYIDRLFGDTSFLGADPYSGGIGFAIASLIVLFPVYIILTRILHTGIRKESDKKELWVRRWLIILTIFGAGVGLLIDLIVLITTFLGGESLTIAFIAKVCAILIIFGGVFFYYIQDVRGVWEKNEGTSKLIGITVSALLILTIIAGFFIIGSPATQRKLRNDNQRISDLQNIQSQVKQYYKTTQKLPETLTSLKDPLVGGYIPSDPRTNTSYEYRTTGPLSFELCATFSLPLQKISNTNTNAGTKEWRVRELQKTAQNWAHQAGRSCFTRTIDPKRIGTYDTKPFPIQ